MKTPMFSFLFAAALFVACNTPTPEKPDTEKKGGDTIPTEDTMVVTPGKVATYITTADNTMHFTAITRQFGEGLNMSPEETLTLNPKKTYQQFDGFGAAITGSAAYNLMQMSAENRTKLLKETFSITEGMGYSYVRVSIGGSDFNAHSNHEYSCCDTKGIENFALTTDELDYVIPVLKEILAINPDLKIMGTPWSCPKWMKVLDTTLKVGHNSWIGGYLNPDYYQDYATYFVKWIQAFEAQGVHITSVTVENEPLNWGNSMSLYMPYDHEIAFIKVLGPAIKSAGLSTKIICFDHNYNYDDKDDQRQYPLKVYADAEASKYVDGAAYHNYGGSPSELETIHKAAPDKNLYFTEASIGTWNYTSFGQSFMQEMENTCLATATRWCKTVIVWNFMLDDNGGPHGSSGACTTCYGCVDVSSKDYTTLTKRSHYYAIGHLSKACKAGSTRIGTSGYTPSNVTVLAADNTDGTYGLVLMNKNDTGVSFRVEAGDKWFNITLPGKSTTSCVWEK